MSGDNAFGARSAQPEPIGPAEIVMDSAPRNWWSTPISGRALVCLLLTLVVSAVVTWFFYTSTQQTIARNTVLKDRGVETTGAVTGFYTTTSGGRHSTTTLHVRYTYDAPSATDASTTQYQASSSIADSQYAQVANDRTVPVIYDPQNPAVVASNIGDWIHWWTPDRSMQGFYLEIGLMLPVIWLTIGAMYVRLARRR